MEIEKAWVLTILVLAFLILFVAGTENLTGNIISDFGSATNPTSGLIILILFIIGALLVFRVFVPESRSESRSY